MFGWRKRPESRLFPTCSSSSCSSSTFLDESAITACILTTTDTQNYHTYQHNIIHKHFCNVLNLHLNFQTIILKGLLCWRSRSLHQYITDHRLVCEHKIKLTKDPKGCSQLKYVTRFMSLTHFTICYQMRWHRDEKRQMILVYFNGICTVCRSVLDAVLHWWIVLLLHVGFLSPVWSRRRLRPSDWCSSLSFSVAFRLPPEKHTWPRERVLLGASAFAYEQIRARAVCE